MRHGIISSCQSAETSETVKHCCSSIVSSAITSTQTFTFYLYHYGEENTIAGRTMWTQSTSVTDKQIDKRVVKTDKGISTRVIRA